MKHLLFLTCGISLAFTLSAQQADNWYFGVHAGLNFTDTVPIVLTDGSIYTPEGCSSISDSAGSLLFYTDGITVWNKLHAVMPNGNGLFGGSSCTQAALVAAQPGSNTLYYVFTLDEIGGPLGFRYSIVDMSLSNGLGDVTEKNILLQEAVTEKLTAVSSVDGSETWIVVHGWGTNAFFAYKLTASGINNTPVVSNAGIIHTTAQIQNTYGQMKFSGCGGRLAVAAGYLDTVEVFDFGVAGGFVSNPVTIPVYAHVYGVEFSPDNSKLYVTCYDPEGTLLQFDLLQANQTSIINSKVTLNSTEDLYALQLAPDGKIYVVKSYGAMLGVINYPDVAGSGCDFVLNGINLDPDYLGASAALGLPNFVQSDFDSYQKGCSLPTSSAQSVPDNTLLIFPTPASDYLYFNREVFGNDFFDICIADMSGKIIAEEKADLTAANARISIASLEAGIYFLQAVNSRKQFNQKIVIARAH